MRRRLSMGNVESYVPQFHACSLEFPLDESDVEGQTKLYHQQLEDETTRTDLNIRRTNRRFSTGNLENPISDPFYSQFTYFNEYEIENQPNLYHEQQRKCQKVNIIQPNIYSPRYAYLNNLETKQKQLKLREERRQDYNEFLKRKSKNEKESVISREKHKPTTIANENRYSPRTRDRGLKFYGHTDFRTEELEYCNKYHFEKFKKMKYRKELDKQIEEKRIAQLNQKENLDFDPDFPNEIYGVNRTCNSCSTSIPVEWASLYSDDLNLCPKCVNNCAFCTPCGHREFSKYTAKGKASQTKQNDLSLIHEEDFIASPTHRPSESKVVIKCENGGMYYMLDHTVKKPVKFNDLLGTIDDKVGKCSKLVEDNQCISCVQKNKISGSNRKAFNELDNRPIFTANAKQVD